MCCVGVFALLHGHLCVLMGDGCYDDAGAHYYDVDLNSRVHAPHMRTCHGSNVYTLSHTCVLECEINADTTLRRLFANA